MKEVSVNVVVTPGTASFIGQSIILDSYEGLTRSRSLSSGIQPIPQLEPESMGNTCHPERRPIEKSRYPKRSLLTMKIPRPEDS